MRSIFGLLTVLLGAVSIAVTSRYGYRLADTVVDGTISAVMFGCIALCAFMFDAAAVRLWFAGHKKIASFIGLLAALALIVTFGNSLGGIVSRGDGVIAERTRIADSRNDDRAELQRLEATLRSMAPFKPTDQGAVDAAKRAADAATRSREAECGRGDPKQRGKNCRDREAGEGQANAALATATVDKASTDGAATLDADIRAVRKRLAEAEPVASPNPLGKALDLILGIAADTATAWQSAIIAAVFELCLVGVMVAFEALGLQANSPRPTLTSLPALINARPIHLKRRGARAPKASADPKEHVAAFLTSTLRPDPRAAASLREVHKRYDAWCRGQSVRPLPAGELGRHLRDCIDAAGIECRADGRDVRLLGAAL